MSDTKWDIIATPTTARNGEVECEMTPALMRIRDECGADFKLYRIPGVGAGRLCYSGDDGRLYQVDIVSNIDCGEDISADLLRAVKLRY